MISDIKKIMILNDNNNKLINNSSNNKSTKIQLRVYYKLKH